MLTDSQLRHATVSNPHHARTLGWDKRLVEVTAFLNVPGALASDPRLAHNTYRFQVGHPPLHKDGMIGPQTWQMLKTALSQQPAAPPDPNAPPPKTSPPTPERIRALDDWLLSLTDGHSMARQPWTFYEAVDTYLGPFGDKGYPIGYGKKYCVLFNADESLARYPVAKAWVQRTTILLQTYLRLYIVDRYRKGTLASLTEAELRQAAFASHPRAYTKGGLTVVLLVSPRRMVDIAAIPLSEFANENASSSWAQLVDTGRIVVGQIPGAVLAGAAGPAHTGGLARAAEKDRLARQRRSQLSGFLDALKKAIEHGKIDRVSWLDRVTRDLHRTEFPDRGLAQFAGDVARAADARKRSLAARYRGEIRLVPDLQRHYDIYDPGWSRW